MRAEFTVRNCNPKDPRDHAAYEQLKDGAAFAHLLSHPYYQADKNLFFVEAAGVIIGYVNVLPELGIGRVVLDYGINPSYRLGLVLAKLFGRALSRAKELGAKFAHVSLPSTETTRAEILSKLGFKPVRRFYELRLDISEANLGAPDRCEWTHSNLKAGGEETLAHIENRCFADTWGYNPNRAEDIAWRLKVKSNCLEDVILAMDRVKVIGYCWTETECGSDLPTGKSKGRIYMLGVAPEYQKKGIGKELLEAGLLHLKSRGREVIDITVDSQNVVAVTLYRSLGFQTWGETVWYEKTID